MRIETIKEIINELEDINNIRFDTLVNDNESQKLFNDYKVLLLDNTSYINIKNIIKNLSLFDTVESYDFFNDKDSFDYIPGNGLDELIDLYKEKLFELTPSNNKEDLYKKKLLEAKNKNADFYEELGKMIVGDNDRFPYRNSTYITKFFQSIGMPQYIHRGETRRLWVADILKQLNIHDLYFIIKCLFRVKDFRAEEKDINLAKKELEFLIEESIEEDEFIDLSDVFNLNTNTELLFSPKINTKDLTLNEKLESSREFFSKGEYKHALENIWDVFERLKSLYNNDKKKSVSFIVSNISDELISQDAKSTEVKDLFFENELKLLTAIGNNYQIRHFESGKKAINNEETQKYLFFRVLSLIDLILKRIGS